MNESAPARMFFALWPTEAQRTALTDWMRAQRGEWRGVAVGPENLHITLVFLGTVAEGSRACLIDAVSALPPPRATLTLDHIEYFAKPQVLYAGVREVPSVIIDLVEALRAAAEGCGIAVERRPYLAHATLMRKVRRRPPPLEIAPLAWPVDGWALVESQTAQEGVRYRVCQRWPASAP